MSAKPKPIYGILLRPLQGQLTRWKEGEKVRVYRIKGVRWLLIEKLRSVSHGSPILNQLCNVPRRAVKIL